MTNFRRASAVFALSTLCLGSAFAQPEYCDTPRLSAVYNFGKMKGASLVTQAWNGSVDCEQIDFFAETVSDAFLGTEVGESPSVLATCHIEGQRDGGLEKLDEIVASCG